MNSSNDQLVTREPAVAGQFYPGNPVELKTELNRLFGSHAKKDLIGNALAIISPHAGYIYSGAVAAAAFMQVDPEREYDTVFVIGSSHRYDFDGASVYSQGNFRTPLGIVPVNIKLSRELTYASSFFTDRSEAQISEHCLEVQLPFLQHWLKKPFQIVPIVVATQNPSTCSKIADALLPYLTSPNLFIISTDFSHYPDYSDACRVDRTTAESIVSGDSGKFLETLYKNEHAGIRGLSTCLCGWTSVLILLYMTEKKKGMHYRLVEYKNSGDALGMENKSRVVGYYAIAVSQSESLSADHTNIKEEMLTREDKQTLLVLARKAIISRLSPGHQAADGKGSLSPGMMQKAGVFVSLHKQGKLRGCLGRFTPDLPLNELVQEMAVASALQDHRFSPLKAEEIPEIEIEISILTPLRRIHSIDELEMGRHGIYIKKGSCSGTYLPQVALSTGWSKQEFLEHCSSDKAGLGRDGWKEAELYTYEAIIIKEV
jgi:MEMO1 family protein